MPKSESLLKKRMKMLDRILDFLFHKTLGLCISIGSAVILMLTLSSCVPLDFCACFCGGMCGDDCGMCFSDCSDECDDEMFYCFGGEYDDAGYYVEDSSCAINECLFGRYGCEAECGDCYTYCGGVNVTCWESLCEGGFCASCEESEYDTTRATWFNCISFCDGADDPESPNYEATYLYSITIVDYYGKAKEFKIYDNTSYISYDSIDGMSFQGYFSEREGKGTRYIDGFFPPSGSTVYAYYTDMYAEVDFTIEVHQRKANAAGDSLNDLGIYKTFSMSSLGNLEAAFFEAISEIPEIDGYQFVQISKDGWSYDGWSSTYAPVKIGDEDGFEEDYVTFRPANYSFSTSSMNKATVVIYLDYEPLKYSVKVHYPQSFGMSTTELTYKFGDTLQEAYDDMPRKKNGKIFAGFAEYDGSEAALPLDTEIVPGMEVYAIFKNPVTITFDGGEGNTPVTNEYFDGEEIELPIPKVSPTGKELDYWMDADSFTGSYAGTITITSDLDGKTLVAKYKIAVYEITLYDGELKLQTLTYTYGTETTLPIIDADFKDFVGWYANDKFSGSAVTKVSATSTGDKEFYAKFTPKKYNVEMNAMGGSISGGYTKQVEFGKSFKLPVPTREGYTFNGWYYQTGVGEKQLTDNAGQSLGVFTQYNGYDYPTASNLDIMVFAKWVLNTYTITFSGEGITTTTTTCNHGNTLQAPQDPTRAGYTFDGWYLGNTKYDFSTKINGAITLTAKFTPKTYKINLVISESAGSFQTSGTKTIQITYVFGKGVVSIGDKPVRDGFTFTGWYTQANGKGYFCIRPDGSATSYLDSQLAAGNITEITLYAGWT